MMKYRRFSHNRLFVFSLLALSAGHKTLASGTVDSPWSVTGMAGASILSPQENGSGLRVSNKQSNGFSLSLDYLWREKFLFSGFYLDAGAAEISAGSSVLGDVGYQYYGANVSWMPFSARNVISPYLKGGVHATQHAVTDQRIKYNKNLNANIHLGLGAAWKFSNNWRLLVDMTSYGKDAFVVSAGLRYQLFNLPPKVKPPVRVQLAAAPSDRDGDGVYDGADLCVETPEGVEVDADGCQIHKVTEIQSRQVSRDADGDGVLDKEDCCPRTALGSTVDERGCALIEIDLSLSTVPFEFASAKLSEVGEKIWGNIAEQIKQFPGVVVELLGHTDSKGSDEFNRRLSLKRSQNVQQFLLDAGVKAEQLRVKAYGESQPVASNDLDEGRSQNRRVEAHLLQSVKQISAAEGLPESCKKITENESIAEEFSLKNVKTSFAAYGFQLLSDSAKETWKKVADRLIDDPDLQVELAGYSDNSGNEELNQQLSQQRAESVRDYLVSLGVDGERLSAMGYGEEDPIADNSTVAGREANRRVEVYLR